MDEEVFRRVNQIIWPLQCHSCRLVHRRGGKALLSDSGAKTLVLAQLGRSETKRFHACKGERIENVRGRTNDLVAHMAEFINYQIQQLINFIIIF